MTEKELCKIMTTLSFWEYNVNRSDFGLIWIAEHSADHFWEKFCDHKKSVIAMWGFLDSNNRSILADYMLKTDFKVGG